MNPLQILITALADQQWHSGQDLGTRFEQSRTAIWKRIAQLREAGLTIESDPRKGYRLVDRIDWFNAEKIKSNLTADTRKRIIDLDIRLSLDSTNQACLDLLSNQDSNAPDILTGYVLLAEQQAAGKGRRGRQWVSPLGCNIYMSLIWRFPAGAGSLAGLSLVVGLSLVKALAAQGFVGLDLKWPNDVQWQQRKLAGILLEVAGDVAGACDVVIGIGLNVAMPKGAASSIDQPWVDLAEINPQVTADKNVLVAELLNQLQNDINEFESLGFSPFQQAWSERDAYAGKNVQLALGGANVVQGVYQGINSDGSLTLATSDGLRNFSGGEISLRQA